jgi:hypothetical protein
MSKTVAILDTENTILNVISVNDDYILNTNEEFYTEDNPAYIGGTYNSDKKVFILPKPNCGHDELLLNDQYRWECSNAEHETLVK